MLKKIALALNRTLKVDFCARPAYSTSEVQKFQVEWTTQQKWQPSVSTTLSPSIAADSQKIIECLLGHLDDKQKASPPVAIRYEMFGERTSLVNA